MKYELKLVTVIFKKKETNLFVNKSNFKDVFRIYFFERYSAQLTFSNCHCLLNTKNTRGGGVLLQKEYSFLILILFCSNIPHGHDKVLKKLLV